MRISHLLLDRRRHLAQPFVPQTKKGGMRGIDLMWISTKSSDKHGCAALRYQRSTPPFGKGGPGGIFSVFSAPLR